MLQRIDTVAGALWINVNHVSALRWKNYKLQLLIHGTWHEFEFKLIEDRDRAINLIVHNPAVMS